MIATPLALLLAIACSSPKDGGDDGGSPGDGGGSTIFDGGTATGDGGGATGDAGATDGGTTDPPLARTEVLVIGAGGSGMAAGLGALQAGAEVMVLERTTHYGGGAAYARGYFAVQTRWQAEIGVEDSVELALSEWPSFTAGSTDHPSVEAYLRGSAATLEWLESLGAGFTLTDSIPVDTGTRARVHSFSETHLAPVDAMGLALGEVIHTGVEATGLRMDGGRVVGAEVRTKEGEGWIAAEAVIVATGGFGRNDARVAVARPGVEDWPAWYEAHPGMDGNGLTMIEAVGGALRHLEGLTLFTHSVPDPQIGGSEVMVAGGLCYAMLVDRDGQRFVSEAEAGSAARGADYLARGPLYAIVDSSVFPRLSFTGRGFNYSDGRYPIILTGEEYEALSPFPSADDPEALAERIGLDPGALRGSLERYNGLVELGVDLDHGKGGECLVGLRTPPYRALPLVMARAKSFGGASMGENGEVLDAKGALIPGLFAAGEAGGFLGGEWIGHGFNGSISAAVWSGRRAGQAAAASLAD